jgi:hypothetical protein
MAWRWPRIAGPGLLVLSVPGTAYGLFFVLYTLGMPPDLVSLWGSAAFLVGGVGVLRRRSAARRPMRHFFVQAGQVGSLAAAFLLYFVLTWPPQGKAILLNLPIMEQAVEPRVWALAGGNWAADWTAPRVTIPEALEKVKRSLESDAWTIVDSSLRGDGTPLISAQRGAYSLVVTYDPDLRDADWSADALWAAYVRRGPARLIYQPGPTSSASWSWIVPDKRLQGGSLAERLIAIRSLASTRGRSRPQSLASHGPDPTARWDGALPWAHCCV